MQFWNLSECKDVEDLGQGEEDITPVFMHVLDKKIKTKPGDNCFMNDSPG